jgi:hypothetical protein
MNIRAGKLWRPDTTDPAPIPAGLDQSMPLTFYEPFHYTDAANLATTSAGLWTDDTAGKLIVESRYCRSGDGTNALTYAHRPAGMLRGNLPAYVEATFTAPIAPPATSSFLSIQLIIPFRVYAAGGTLQLTANSSPITAAEPWATYRAPDAGLTFRIGLYCPGNGSALFYSWGFPNAISGALLAQVNFLGTGNYLNYIVAQNNGAGLRVDNMTLYGTLA